VRRFRSSGFPARVLSFVYGPSGDRRTVAGALQDDGLTRSREAAKGDAVGLLLFVLNCLLSSQLSRIYSLWHGCHGPLTPDPSPPFHGGEGRIVCFVAVKNRNSTHRPWKGTVDGGEGYNPPCTVPPAVLSRLFISREAAKPRRRGDAEGSPVSVLCEGSAGVFAPLMNADER